MKRVLLSCALLVSSLQAMEEASENLPQLIAQATEAARAKDIIYTYKLHFSDGTKHTDISYDRAMELLEQKEEAGIGEVTYLMFEGCREEKELLPGVTLKVDSRKMENKTSISYETARSLLSSFIVKYKKVKSAANRR